MKDNYIELKQNRDFGEIIATYFDFFKQNLKSFTNIFISYNGIFILLLLVISYLMVTGFIGLYDGTSEFGNTTNSDESIIFIGIGVGVIFIVFIFITALNYSLASSYVIKYEQNKTNSIDRKEVWNYIKIYSGNILVFILLLIPIYIVFAIVSLILAFIPIIGTLVQYVLQFALSSWIGVSFMVMMYENKSASDALGEGWDLIRGNFWKCIGVNFILGILLGMILILIIVAIPGVIFGIYTFLALNAGEDITNSITAKIVYTIVLCLVLITFAYSQPLSQFINGILYFSLHEQKYNVNTREKINQIGSGE